MIAKISRLLLLFLLAQKMMHAQSDWVPLGSGGVKIVLSSPGLLLKGIKVYPGEEIRLVARGQVRYNWEEKVDKNCFLWWCDETRIIYNNFRSPGSLPAKVFIRAKDDNSELKSGGFALTGNNNIRIPEQYDYNKAFEVFAYFDDPGINRLRSDGEYEVNAFINFSGRLAYLKNYIASKGSSLTFDMINSKDVISDLFAKTCAEKIAVILSDHIGQFPAISQRDQQLILDYVYKLDPANPRVSLALAKNALTRFNIAAASVALQRARSLILDNGADPSLLAESYNLFGKYYETIHSGSMQEGALLDASGSFGMAAENYLKAGQYDSVIEAYYNQSRVLKTLGYVDALEKSLEVLNKADALSSRLYVIQQNSKYGFMNNFGRITVKPEYDSIKDSRSYVVPAKKNGKWGYIDILGNAVIDFTYEDAGFFRDGIAWVRSNGHYIYINGKGKKLINEEFRWASDFYRNFAFVLDDTNGYYYINKKGEKFAQIGEAYIRLTVCNRGSCTPEELVKKLAATPNAYITVISAFTFRFFNAVKVAPYNRKSEPNGMFGVAQDLGLIDEQGNIIRRANDDIRMITYNKNTFYMVMSNNLVKVYDFNLNEKKINGFTQNFNVNALGNGAYSYFYPANPSLSGFINDEQLKKTEPIFRTVFPIDDQLTFCADDTRYRIIKQNGTYLFDRPTEGKLVSMTPCCFPAFDFVSSFGFLPAAPQPVSGGPNYLLIRYNDRQSFKTTKVVMLKKSDLSEVITGDEYSDISTYRSDGQLMMVQKTLLSNNPIEVPKMKKGIYKIGTGLVIPCEYDTIKVKGPAGSSVLSKNGKTGLANTETGQLVIPLNYDRLDFFNDSMLLAVNNNHSGIISADNQVQVPFEYDELGFVSKGDEMGLTYSELLSADPVFFPIPLAGVSESFVSCKRSGKTGIIDLGTKTELIKPVYDKIFLLDDKFICANETTPDHKGDFSFRMFNMFGTPFIQDELIYLRYDASDRVFVCVTKENKIKMINSRGDVILSGDISYNSAGVTEAISTEKYRLTNLTWYSQGRQLAIGGEISKLVKQSGKLLLLSRDKIIHLNTDNGYMTETGADNLVAQRF